LNDAWPAISWSSIDYFGRWKPLQYMAKRLYPDVAIYCINNKIVAINDNLYPVNALAKLTIQYFNGTVDSKKTY
jgi:beta-mannosidase